MCPTAPAGASQVRLLTRKDRQKGKKNTPHFAVMTSRELSKAFRDIMG